MITSDAKCHVEIRRRIAMGKDAFYKRKELLRGKLNKNLKKRIIKSVIWSVVLYGSETWTLRKEDIKRSEAFEMWIWHRMERISWMEHRSNEEILQMVDEKNHLYMNNSKPTDKLAGPHNERRLPSKNYNRGKNGKEN